MVVGVWPFAFAVADGTFESRFPERARFGREEGEVLGQGNPVRMR